MLIWKGNFRRYLVYGLGEILLVVSGIFILLQVNNWNEEPDLIYTIDPRNQLIDFESYILSNSSIYESLIKSLKIL
jgi:hypothetical protein